ncbi:MAG: esterase [Bacteroidales bacterium]|nr:esterase [Bacteroidales bacterium]
MKTRIFTAFFLLVALQFSSLAQEKYQFRHQGLDREYWMYIPENLPEQAPLVFVLHGYGGKAEGYCPQMIETARKHGFAVCYPQGEKAPKGKTGWNVGYPKQEGMKTDDIDFICDLARHVQKKFSLSRKNTFFSGMSNGGEMCYIMAMQHPEAFSAYASVAGLTMEWAYRSMSPKMAVPLMEIHGTADKTSLWEGDPDNNCGWGEYISVPLAVGVWAAEAKCTHTETVELPVRNNKVLMHRHLGGSPAWEGGPEIEVRLYEVVGGKHSWTHKDMDTCEEIWKFFSKYLR